MALTARANEAEVHAPFKIGFRVLNFDYQQGGQTKTLIVAVWYPTKAQPRLYNYGGPTAGVIALDAQPDPAGAPYPFLTFSHGYGGGGLSSPFLMEALGSRGWIVACPDHNNAHSTVRIKTGQKEDLDRAAFLRQDLSIGASGPHDREKYSYRLDELELVIKSMFHQKSSALSYTKAAWQ